MPMLATRSPLEPIGMNGAGSAPSRRSARLSVEGAEENEPPAGRRTKLLVNGAQSTSVETKEHDGQSAVPAPLATKRKRKVYDEDVDGFSFNKSKRVKDKAPPLRHSTAERTSPVPAAQPAPPTSIAAAPKSAQMKMRRRLPTTPERDAAEKPVRRSKRLSNEHSSPEAGHQASPHKPAHAKSHANNDRSPGREKLHPLTIEKRRRARGAEGVEEEKVMRIHLPFADTPVIKRNKEMRKASAEGAHRRSSSGMRGRRASSLIDEGRGNALPHAEVPTAEFFKHISADLTEPRRMRCLLGWCGQRALPPKPEAPRDSGPAATLEFQALQAARVVEEELSQDLITKGILSDWFSRDDSVPPRVPLRKKPNPRNVANAAKAEELERELERLKKEQAEWAQLLSEAVPPVSPQKRPSGGLSPLQPDLLDSPQRDVFELFEGSTATTTSISSIAPQHIQQRLHALSDGLEFRVDLFADGVHALSTAQATAERLASHLLADASDVLEKREAQMGKAGAEITTMDALRGLARVLNVPAHGLRNR